MSCGPTVCAKRGASLTLQHRVKIDGKVADLTGWSFASTVKNGDQTLGEFIITPTNLTGGQIQMVLHTTDDWPLGTFVFDVKYTLPDGYVHYSPNINLSLAERITP